MFLIFPDSPGPPEEPKQESEWEEDAPEVAHLHDDDFDDFIQQHSSVLVMFYAPCKLNSGDISVPCIRKGIRDKFGIIFHIFP